MDWRKWLDEHGLTEFWGNAMLNAVFPTVLHVIQ
jgi:hypothetical protein